MGAAAWSKPPSRLRMAGHHRLAWLLSALERGATRTQSVLPAALALLLKLGKGAEFRSISTQALDAWNCTAQSLVPMRFLIESMDEDHTSRSLVPVTLASGGYVDIMNGGWDHQTAKSCGGYGCLTRLMTFHATSALAVSGDKIAMTSTRLRFQNGAKYFLKSPFYFSQLLENSQLTLME